MMAKRQWTRVLAQMEEAGSDGLDMPLFAPTTLGEKALRVFRLAARDLEESRLFIDGSSTRARHSSQLCSSAISFSVGRAT